jgi:two-component system, cell cycle sensor histidine kinase and response regulator CckA
VKKFIVAETEPPIASRLVPASRREARDVCMRLGEQFVQSQKMDVIGQLAGSIAHDFNNILSIILGYSEMIKQGQSSGNKTYEQAEKIRLAAEQATALTRQLLTFSRPQHAEPLVLDLNEVLRGTEQILHRLVRENIVMTTRYGDDLGSIKAHAGSIGQILMNLVVNARDAMPEGGSLIMSTRNITLTESRPGLEMAPGEYVILEVSDTGEGMTPEVKARLFEAFFTTKTKENGTGLGLTICATFLKAAGGYIEVESEVGLGATFKVYFPRVERAALSASVTPADPTMPTGTETLLVVEDEAEVRHLAVAVLEAQGYTVLRSHNGQDALRVVRQHRGDPIKLVVSDVIMPQMNGNVMAEWLKTIDPGLRVLFTSGYNDDAISKDGVLEPGVAYLSKPYTSSTLAHKVREVLDAPAGEP